ncbi:hypothetical protein [Blastococcus deserti]|uniref:Acetone carboxylase n=1 Tax=Blastococcus deserti TaxID=2259033 RepID=A0ABW4XGU8_9ACTN
MDDDPVDGIALCSAKGCRERARWRLVWNNPRVHTPDREKVWAACDGHREALSHHLAIRAFLRRVEPYDDEASNA